MNIYNDLRQQIAIAINQFAVESNSEEIDISLVTVEIPKETSHGDISTNVAMILAKQFKTPPKVLATEFANRIKNIEIIETVEVAGPGFINLKVKNKVWYQIMLSALSKGAKYGEEDIGKGEKINIEYVSCNPTGPMHIGHARSASYGDSLCRLLKKVGYKVIEEFYINDAGSQIEKLAKSTYLRYEEVLGKSIKEIPEGLYPGEYLIPVACALADSYGKSLLDKHESEWLPLIKEFSTNAMLDMIKEDLCSLGVEHEVFTSEYSLHKNKMIEKAVDKLKQNDLIYLGVLEPPKGQVLDDWEPKEQLLFKSTNFGDDVDRTLKRSDGSWTYFASDCAYILDKIERGFNNQIMLLGADHAGYQKRMLAIALALGDGKVKLDIRVNQMVNLFKNGKPFKMSKRAGNFITVKEVIEEVGAEIIRFIMLTRKNDMIIDFDLEKVKEQSKDNPVFYVQYAYARCCSVMRNVASEAKESLRKFESGDYDVFLLNTPEEIELLKLLASWPRAIEKAAEHHEPHRIAYFLQDLAAIFHGLWNLGREKESMKFIINNNVDLTTARIAMIKWVMIVIESGLNIFNVKPLENM
jgi:arginyl-tRNA synthetase